MGGRPVVAIAVGEAADHRALVHHLGVRGEELADVEAGEARTDWLEGAAELCRGVGLHVEGVELRRAAMHPDEDHALPRLGTRMDEPGGLRSDEIGKRQPEGPKRPDMDGAAARDPVAHRPRKGCVPEDGEHGENSQKSTGSGRGGRSPS